MTTVQTKMKQTWIPWIWEIPEDWEVKKLRHIWNFTASWIDKKNNENEKNVKMVNYTDVYWNDKLIINSNMNFMETTCPENKVLIHNVVKWDLIFTPSSETIKDIWLSALIDENLENTVYSYHVLRFRFYKEFNHTYQKYLCNNSFVLNQFSKESKWTTRQILNRDEFNNTLVVIPSIINQEKIATFLDQKTLQISSFIKNKKRLIELLEEQKISIINKAVTKWLDENVKMKDSWIPWIWEIPEDWEVRKLKHFITILTDFTANWSFWDLAKNVKYLDYWFSRVIRLTDLRVNFENTWIYVNELAHKYLKKSELFWWEILIANVWAYTWFVCVMPKVNFTATLWPNMFLLRFNNEVFDKFVYYFLLSDFWNKQFVIEADSTAQPKLNKYEVKNIIIFKPKIETQNQIVEYIEKELEKINNTIQKIEKEISLIEEYRDSLIYHAVTWKLNIW